MAKKMKDVANRVYLDWNMTLEKLKERVDAWIEEFGADAKFFNEGEDAYQCVVTRREETDEEYQTRLVAEDEAKAKRLAMYQKLKREFEND